MIPPIIFLTVAGPFQALGGENGRLRQFRNKQCGLAFRYPAEWHVTPQPECTFLIQPPDYAAKIRQNDVDVYTIHVSSGIGSFEDAAAESNFYRPQAGDDLSRTEAEHVGEWLCTTGQVPGVPHRTKRDGYRGLECGIPARCYHEGGGYFGQCDWFFGFVSSGGRWLSVSGFDSGVPRTILHGATLAATAKSPEVEVIQTVSRDILFCAKEAPEGNYLLIESRTTQFELTEGDEARAAEAGIPAVLLRALADQRAHDMQFFPETSDLRPVAPAEITQIFADGPRWDRFYARFPKSRGFVQFSGPVFSVDRTHALLWVDYNCRGDCGWGSVVYLEIQNGKWVKTREWLRYIN